MIPQEKISRPQMEEVFGFQVPIEKYYLHRGHAWAALQDDGRVRVGLDEFSQKLLGQADEIRLPEVGKVYYQSHICMALFREGKRSSFEAPVDGAVEEINPMVRQNPRLVHDDPYGEGWLYIAKPTNLQQNLKNLLYGQEAVIWINEESHHLINLVETQVGVALPDGGAIVDDVYGNYQELGWQPLVKEFFVPNLTRVWKKRPAFFEKRSSS
jgi:glycine cleavage system H lipoate-binding protein